MKYIRNFSAHTDYEAEMSKIPTPSVSYCRKENECHFMPSNVIMFKVGDLNGNTNQTVTVWYKNDGYPPFITDEIPITEGNRWYVVNLPSDKSFYKAISSVNIEEVILSGVISNREHDDSIIPKYTKSVKLISCELGMSIRSMFYGTSSLVSLDFSLDTSKVTNMSRMFMGCTSLKTIFMKGCNQTTIDKVKAQLKTDDILNNVTIITE